MDDKIQIKIKITSNAQVYAIKILKSDTIQTLKEKCEKEASISPNPKFSIQRSYIIQRKIS